jgi:ABC-type transport system involved in multi-copper enzyme maturation permease subunit
VVFLLLITVGITGAVAWSSFRPLQNQRDFLTRVETGTITPENFFEFSPGVSCFGDFGRRPAGGESVGPAEPSPGSPTPSATETSPGPVDKAPPSFEPVPPVPGADEPTCQFVGPDGTPIGPTFQGDPIAALKRGEVTQSFIDELKPQIVASLRKQVDEAQKELGLRRLLQSRIRSLGTFVGILFAVLFSATFLGAEIRWGVWRTLLTHEPRRGRMVASKLGAMLTYVLVGFILCLVVSTVIDVLMRNVLDVSTSANVGPAISRLVKEAGWAALSLGVYATISGALTLTVRTSLAGVTALLLLLGDHLLVSKFTWLRAYLPVQNVASLLPQPATITSGYVWPPLIEVKFQCVRQAGTVVVECKEIMLERIPHGRASLVLGAWVIGFMLAAWAAFRSRDVPQ